MFNGFYPVITRSSTAISNTTTKVSDRIESRIEILQVGDNGTDVYIWIKNIGSSEIVAIEHSDLFFGPTDNFYRVNHGTSPVPCWEYLYEGGNSRWTMTVTAKIILHPAAPLTPGTYLVKFVIPNGIFDELTYTVE
jgi:flagellar protein FlaG